MPNLITHYYFKNLVKDKLKGKALEIVNKEPEAFKLGAIGPDFLFALRELGFKEKLYPNTMQYIKMYEVFYEAGLYIRNKHDDTIFSYMLGLMCHYVSDFMVHPFVNYFIERGHAKLLPINQIPSIHTLIESAIDSHICEEKYNIPCHKFPAAKTCSANRKVKLKIGKLYEDVINKIFGFDTKAKRACLSFTLTGFFMRFSIDRFGIKKYLFDKVENIRGGNKMLTGLIRPPEAYKKIDYMNRNKKKWLKVRNGKEYSTESVDELLERAVDAAVMYMENYTDFILTDKPLNKKDFTVNYEGVEVY